MKSNKIKAFSVLGLSLAVQTAFAGNITAINVSALPDNQKVVKVRFDRDVVSPTGFVTTTPSSIALDFPNTSIALAQPDLEYADPLLGKITAAQNNDRARILLGLNSAGQYNTEIRGNEVWVYVSAATNVSNQSTYTSATASTASPQIGASATVDFRKASKTSGIVDVSVPGFNGTPIIKRQSDRVVITLKNYPLPTQAQRNLDVTDFDTPVKSVVMKRLGNDTEITIRNQGSWELQDRSSKTRLSYQITRKDNLESAGFKQTSKSFNGKRISLDFQDVDVRTVLQILGKESGMNIVASDSVTGKITISVKDVPWDQALDLVMQARNLDKRQQGNIINIAPRDELLEKDKAVLKAQQDLEQMGPLYSQTFQLKYKNVEEFRKVLRLDETSTTNSNTRSILSSRGSALIDPATNTLIITDNPAVLQKFQKLIAELDVPARQVMVEARIVEATSGFSRELGVRFGRTSNSNGRTTWNSNVNVPISAVPTGTLTLVRALSSASLNLTLQARQAENEVRIISSPRVLTQDRKAATIQSGFEVPYQVVSDGTVSYEFKKAVLGMTVTPHITPDGQIIMDLQINKDSPENCDAQELCIRTRNVKTNAMVEDGGTLIVGGIYEETNDNRQTKVPLLGDIPVVGNLFKYRSRGVDRSELLIFITPRVMDNSGNSLRY